MESKIKNIAKIEIKHLWNNSKLNFVWELNQDVNILAGDNGTGKSTVLDLVSNLLKGSFKNDLDEIIKYIKITFNTGQHIIFEKIEDSLLNLEKKAQRDNNLKEIIQDLKRDKGKEFNKIKSLGFNRISFESLHIQPDKLNEIIGIEYIKTFDQKLIDKETAEHIVGHRIQTDLDIQISKLQTKYLNYQIDLGKRALDLTKSKNTQLDIKIDEKLLIFKETINKLFEVTKKHINPNDNYISFIQNKNILKPFQLSSGEKQLLIILLTALVQDNKPFIVLMDEPEISLHTDWQEQLVESILKLNENAQIIIATHSPFVVSHRWTNKVFQIENLIKTK
jgi:predicted ATPase